MTAPAPDDPIKELSAGDRELAERLRALRPTAFRRVACAAARTPAHLGPVRDTFCLSEFVELHRGSIMEPGVLDLMPSFTFLRPIRQPLFDTERGSGSYPLNLFVDNKKFHDGTAKTTADTNARQSGILGNPDEFDIEGLEVHFESEKGDLKELLRGTVVSLVYG